MARTPSTMVSLGTKAPAFSLPDPDGQVVSLDDFTSDPALLVVFLCNHCPFVKHIRSGLAEFAREFRPRGMAMVAINSNDISAHPNDAPEYMAVEADEAGYVFPYLFDETQDVAKRYGAACTPDFFLYDADRSLVYRGQFDDSRPGKDVPVTGADLAQAVEALLAGETVSPHQTPSLGCNIKWIPGNEPEWFGAS